MRGQRGRRWWRGAGLAALVALGALIGVTAAFVHRTRIDVLGLTVPVGLLAVLGAVAAVVLLARLLTRSRLGVGLVGAAVYLPILVLSQFRPEGDLVVAEDAWGLWLLGGVALVLTVGMVVPFSTYHGGAAAGADVGDGTGEAPTASSPAAPAPTPPQARAPETRPTS